jgi:DNA-directed RNA polymerase subunit RPC12/RpoP
MADITVRKCPECGFELLAIKFRHPDPLFARAYADIIGKAAMRASINLHYCGADFAGNWAKREAASGHWEYICLNCGYSWREKPSLVLDPRNLSSAVAT